jgi:hypothetical protein
MRSGRGIEGSLMLTRAAVLLAVVMTTACAPQVRSVRFDGAAEPRPDTHPIRIYSSRVPDCPYEEMGLVRAREAPAAIGTSMEALLEAMRVRARRMGGDAIVGIAQAGTPDGSPASGVSLNASDGLSGTVVRFTDPACTTE